MHRRIALAACLMSASCSSRGKILSIDLPSKVGGVHRGLQDGYWRHYDESDGRRGDLLADGNYEEDKQVGRWTYYYPPDETQRAAGDHGLAQWEVGFENEGLSGPTTFYHPNGTVLATGAFAGGSETGPWSFFAADGTKIQEGSFNGARRTGFWKYWDHEGRPVAEGTRDGSDHVGNWTFWLPDGTPYEVDFSRPNKEGSWLTDELLAHLDRRPPIPVQPQPDLTMLEEDLRDYLLVAYTIGREEARLPEDSPFVSQSPRYHGASPGKLKHGNERKAQELIGRELPVRYLADPLGQNADLLESASQGRWSVLVILRGQTDEVCIYCMAQTESIALSCEEFERRDADILIVYPGDSQRLSAFMKIYHREFGEGAELDFVYDEDFGLVNGLGLQDRFALPSTLILDERGVIRDAYVGLRIDDRPAARTILELLDEVRATN